MLKLNGSIIKLLVEKANQLDAVDNNSTIRQFITLSLVQNNKGLVTFLFSATLTAYMG